MDYAHILYAVYECTKISKVDYIAHWAFVVHERGTTNGSESTPNAVYANESEKENTKQRNHFLFGQLIYVPSNKE